MQPLYNREGRAIAYIADNGISIYTYDGNAAGWVYQESLVFAYGGKFLGWLMYGWLCDPAGNPAFFTDRSSGGPRRPARQPRPIRSSRESRPSRRQRQVRPPRPGMTMTWSEHSNESFFAVAAGEEGGPLEEGAPLEEAASSAEPDGDVSPSEISEVAARSESSADARPSDPSGGEAPAAAPVEPEAAAPDSPAADSPAIDSPQGDETE